MHFLGQSLFMFTHVQQDTSICIQYRYICIYICIPVHPLKMAVYGTRYIFLAVDFQEKKTPFSLRIGIPEFPLATV